MLRSLTLLVAALAISSQATSAVLSNGFDFPLGPPNGDGYEFADPNGTAFLEPVTYDGCGTVPHPGEDWNADSSGKDYGGDKDDKGDPIYAVSNGTVTYTCEPPCNGFGRAILIHHTGTFRLPSGGVTNDVWSWYAHLASIEDDYKRYWMVGDSVGRGEKIGTVGDFRGAYHLHFEIRSVRLTNDDSFVCAAEYRSLSYIKQHYLPPSEFIKLNRPPTVIVNFGVVPESGDSPLKISLAVRVSGTATGPIRYALYCDSPSSSEDIISGAIHEEITTESLKSFVDICTYSHEGVFTPKVIVEREGIRTQRTKTVVVGSSCPAFGGTGIALTSCVTSTTTTTSTTSTTTSTTSTTTTSTSTTTSTVTTSTSTTATTSTTSTTDTTLESTTTTTSSTTTTTILDPIGFRFSHIPYGEGAPCRVGLPPCKVHHPHYLSDFATSDSVSGETLLLVSPLPGISADIIGDVVLSIDNIERDDLPASRPCEDGTSGCHGDGVGDGPAADVSKTYFTLFIFGSRQIGEPHVVQQSQLDSLISFKVQISWLLPRYSSYVIRMRATRVNNPSATLTTDLVLAVF